jgi:hypothetical protein
MAKRNFHEPEHNPKREHEHEHEHEHKHRPDRDREESGDDPTRHAKIIERRWLGSPRPTAERYARAIRQWHALPGAVMWPATDAPAQPSPAGSAGRGNKA